MLQKRGVLQEYKSLNNLVSCEIVRCSLPKLGVFALSWVQVLYRLRLYLVCSRASTPWVLITGPMIICKGNHNRPHSLRPHSASLWPSRHLLVDPATASAECQILIDKKTPQTHDALPPHAKKSYTITLRYLLYLRKQWSCFINDRGTPAAQVKLNDDPFALSLPPTQFHRVLFWEGRIPPRCRSKLCLSTPASYAVRRSHPPKS